MPTVVDGSIPNQKSDLTHFYVASEVGSNNDIFMYLGWERVNTLGTANIDFEFNQSPTISTNGVTPVRTPGDMLISFDFASGGNVVNLTLHRWTGSAWDPAWPLRQRASPSLPSTTARADGRLHPISNTTQPRTLSARRPSI